MAYTLRRAGLERPRGPRSPRTEGGDRGGKNLYKGLGVSAGQAPGPRELQGQPCSRSQAGMQGDYMGFHRVVLKSPRTR